MTLATTTAAPRARLQFDHVVIGAADLEQGAAWAAEVFGAAPPIGGAHPGLGTHNRLARLPQGYVEILAPDPAQGIAPQWMGLGDPAILATLAARPKPIAWMLSTDDLDAAARAAAWDVGDLVPASRGDLSWRLTVPKGGGPVEGVLPTLIEWPASLGHKPPTERMAPLGPRGAEMALGALRLKHPDPGRIEALLSSVGAAEAAAAAGFSLTVSTSDQPEIEAAFRRIRIDRSV